MSLIFWSSMPTSGGRRSASCGDGVFDALSAKLVAVSTMFEGGRTAPDLAVPLRPTATPRRLYTGSPGPTAEVLLAPRRLGRRADVPGTHRRHEPPQRVDGHRRRVVRPWIFRGAPLGDPLVGVLADAQFHSSEEVTDTYYIAKPVQAPDVSEILERLGTDPDGRPTAVGHNDAHG
ncbi:hypothetical protein [Plantactinospora soyae]|uniref:Uncharacterized protein n=1 Tax=Plantactinospora soyae TaxID=1544732 RepID=A0A927MDN2_9ACTN|nr:hypothetical protein [Plantactinospora soyae]MBE1489175.1 hypothetical protein [Plantactinospora soyae]